MKAQNVRPKATALIAATMAAFATMSPANDSPPALHFTEYTLSPFTYPGDIIAGRDGALWFTQIDGIGRITTAGVVTLYSGPAGDGFELTESPHQNFWFTDPFDNAIVRMTATGRGKIYPLLRGATFPWGIATDQAGRIWFAEFNYSTLGQCWIGEIDATGTITEYPVPTLYTYPHAITLGPDNAMWFTESGAGGRGIARITSGGEVTEFPLTDMGQQFSSIATGSDGALWVTDDINDTITRISTSGTATVYPTPTLNSEPESITRGANQTLWFVEHNPMLIGRITTSGVITEFTPPTSSPPTSIVLGSDGAMWFTQAGVAKIVRFGP